MHPMLNIAVRAARAAGNLIARNLGQNDLFEVEEKQHNDFVTTIDKECEQTIVNTLLKSYRDHGILSEEAGNLGNPDSEYQWIIDPLDGTMNFVQGIAHSAVSIALTQNGRTELGVVFDPMLNEMFTAIRGGGASLNGRRLRVANRDSLDAALICTAFPTRHRERMGAYLEIFNRLINHCADMRRSGSAALDLCYVACGRFDGYLEQGLKPWDFAAGELIVREAGGLVSDFAGENDYRQSGNVVAANPQILRALIKICDPQSLPAVLR